VRNGVQPPPRFGHAAGIVNGQVMIIFGGSGVAGVLNDIWQFDIAGYQWRQLSPSVYSARSVFVVRFSPLGFVTP
jgi:Galactose oxidase, central domain